MASTLDLRNKDNLSYAIADLGDSISITLTDEDTGLAAGTLVLTKNLMLGTIGHLQHVMGLINGSFEENYVPAGRFNTVSMQGSLTLQPPPEMRM